MKQCTIHNESVSISSRDILTEILRQGAQEMLAQAINNEVAEYIHAASDLRDDQGHRLVVRNGYLPARTIRTGVGPVEIRQPRVNDKRTDENGQRMRFSSSAALPATHKEHRRADPLALPQGRKHRRLHRCPTGLVRPGCPGSVSDQYCPAEGLLAVGMGRLVETFAGGQALRLCLGRWHLFQCSPGGFGQ